MCLFMETRSPDRTFCRQHVVKREYDVLQMPKERVSQLLNQMVETMVRFASSSLAIDHDYTYARSGHIPGVVLHVSQAERWARNRDKEIEMLYFYTF